QIFLRIRGALHLDQADAKLLMIHDASIVGINPGAQAIKIEEGTIMADKVIKTDEEWKRELTPEQYAVTRKKGTERAFTGKYYKEHDKGEYRCVCCGNALFSSDTKFESGTGWPSFWAPIAEEN